MRNIQPWSEEELAFLAATCDKPTTYVASTLGRSTVAVEAQKHRRGLTHAIAFTSEERLFMREHATEMTGSQLAQALGRSRVGVLKFLRHEGIASAGTPNLWAEWEDEFLRTHYANKSQREIGDYLGRTVLAVRSRANKLGIQPSLLRHRYETFDPNPVEVCRLYLDEHWSGERIAKELRCPPSRVYALLHEAGITRTIWQTARFTSIHKNMANPGRYLTRAGYIMVNVYDAETDRFRKVFEHRYVMEQHIGRKLRPDEVVHHLNHNKTDNRIENLLILSSGEHTSLHFRGIPWVIARPGRLDPSKRKRPSRTKKHED